ncbi:MAG TPA: zf-HC2 domain-containing protein [Terriglobia bacterium]|nr:zf-HC2 domain-containing protein [Terriglobia bacterium]
MVIEISCEEVWREISNYLENDVSPQLRARLEAHFKGCAHCTAVLKGAGNVVQLVNDGSVFDLPDGFSNRLYKRLQDRLATGRRKSHH